MACFPGAIFLSDRARTLSSKQVCYHVGRPEKPGRTKPAPSRRQVEVDTVNESVARIEAIIGRKVKRDIGQMTEWAKGNLARAAEAIMNTPNAHVGIITGFYIQHAEPPSPETDGLGGMAHLAAGLANAGVPVRSLPTNRVQRRYGPWSMRYRCPSILRSCRRRRVRFSACGST